VVEKRLESTEALSRLGLMEIRVSRSRVTMTKRFTKFFYRYYFVPSCLKLPQVAYNFYKL